MASNNNQIPTLNEENENNHYNHYQKTKVNQFMTVDDPLFFCAACESDDEGNESEGLIVL